MQKSIKLFDTTLRDGSQGENISFSVEDKLRIARKLDQFGIHYIEGGWPGSNPRDADFFEAARNENFSQAKLVAFGSTRRAGVTAAKDSNLQMLLAAETPAISLFGKSWKLHAREALGVTPEQNLELIADSVAYLKKQGREIIYDGEHFFDGFKDDPEYALQTLLAAHASGADVLVLCDTNGGSLPHEIARIVAHVRKEINCEIGIHAHNDGELAVANSLAAVQAGARHVQGTINGFGERCGNANLISTVANLQLKLGFSCVEDKQLQRLSELSGYVYELANVMPREEAAFVGMSAFAHKGGVHVSAVMKNPATYEHIEPVRVGNRRRVLVSDLSGRSNIRYKMSELEIGEGENAESARIVEAIKQLENQGYSFEAAEASLELMIQRERGDLPVFFTLSRFRVNVEKNGDAGQHNEASIRVQVGDIVEHTAAEGDGPVNALDNALRKALLRFYPDVALMHLVDYKVRVLNDGSGTASRVRVLLESQSAEERWTTVGVSSNILQASWQALQDSFTYYLYKAKQDANLKEISHEPQNLGV